MTCQRYVHSLDAFVDGELGPGQIMDVEQHLTECEICVERVRFTESMRRSLQQTVRAQAIASDAFRARLASAVAAEKAREDKAARDEGTPPSGWATIAPLAAAAALTLIISAAIRERDEPEDRLRAVSDASQVSPPATLSVEQLLDELVDYHAAPPTPQITEASLVPRMEPEVGVPVHLPELGQYGARWEGSSVIPVRNQRAAVFRYRLSDHPVTIYVYNSRRVPLRGALEPRVVRNTAVHVGERRGYSIAAMEQRGVGYAVATDLDGNESAELVASLH